VEVQTQFFQSGERFALIEGGELPGLQLAYETYGRLAEDRSNAILLFHAMTGSQHAAGYNPGVPGLSVEWTEECREGWWDQFIGPGRVLDTDRYFIICVNHLGGCYGSTGPSSINPLIGRPYGGAFPAITTTDILRSQLLLVDSLGISKLLAAIGGSIGGLLSLELAVRYPKRVRGVVPIASGSTVTNLQRLLNLEQILAIQNDPNFAGGDYYEGPRPNSGLALARMIAHKTFISLKAMNERARDEVNHPEEAPQGYLPRTSQESYMLHQGRKFTQRFDANAYLRILEAWQTFDLLRGRPETSRVELFRRMQGLSFLLFTIDSDVCFYPEEQEQLAAELKAAGVRYLRSTVHSDKGHDSFLLEPELYSAQLGHFLDSLFSHA
jgi:homoserine O-acetyltransferase